MTFNYPSEVMVLRTRLEADDIECLVLDELIVHMNPLYSNAVGGVRLQVRESDVPRAIEILKENGYTKVEDVRLSKSFTFIDKATLRIPLLNELRFELRMAIILAVSILALAGIIYVATLP